jgi:Tfp pilus assembly protein PilF
MASTRILIAAALLAGAAAPAHAGIAVIGANSARLCYQLAESMRHPGTRDIARCDAALEEGGISHHDIVATYVNRGILKLRRGQLAPAIADFDTALALDPNQPEAYLNKGAALLQQNDMRGALPLFAAALEHNTNRPALAHFGRAIANETLGNAAAAYRDYRAASALEPDWAEPRQELQRFRLVPR